MIGWAGGGINKTYRAIVERTLRDSPDVIRNLTRRRQN